MRIVMKAFAVGVIAYGCLTAENIVSAQDNATSVSSDQTGTAQRARRERGLPFSCGYDYFRRRGQLSNMISQSDPDQFCFNADEYTRIFREEVGVREATTPANLVAYLNSPAVQEIPMDDPRVDLRKLEVFRRESGADYSTFRRNHRAADKNGTVLYSEEYGVIMIASCLNPVIDASVQGPRTLPPPPPVGLGIAVSPS